MTQALARWLLIVLILGGGSSAPLLADDQPVRPAAPVYRHGIVVADHPLASEAGAEILRKGGNVVDAAVATAFALSVVRPEGCGIGGGGFMVLWDADRQQAVALDYRERAPQAATRDMFQNIQVDVERAGRPSEVGGLAVAIPGDVAGLCFALEEYGTLDRATVLSPAIRLCRDGVPVDDWMRTVQRSVLRDFERHPEYRERFGALWSLYLNNGVLWPEDARFYSPLGEVLERIARLGPEGFYEGEVGQAMAAAIRSHQGIVTADDLRTVQPVVVREPLRGKFRQYELLAMPPPSSGGIAIIETLNILEAIEERPAFAPLAELPQNSPEAIHRITEALKHAFADRAEFLGDADQASVPVGRLTSREYAREIAGRFDPARTLSRDEYGRGAPVNDGGTSHFCVMDARGNAVACTETINTYFGSYVVEPRFGIVLNNEMDDFAAVPGEPNAFGLIQSEANAIAPGKKPLSSMSPTLLVLDGKACFAVGASGGPRIISSTLQTLLNMVVYGMPPGAAVDAPRFHHQWIPETLFLEDGLLDPRRASLQERGHELKRIGHVGTVQAARRTGDELTGASDSNKGGQPAGW